MQKKGKIKFTDPDSGYGYILADDADGPSSTTLFEDKDAQSAIDALVPGADVVFEVESPESNRATQVRAV